MLLNALKDIPDERGMQGRKFVLAEILFCSVLAITCGADSYRSIDTFIKEKWKALKFHFNLKISQPPSYSTIRRSIILVDPKILESTLRAHALSLTREYEHICIDGKTLRKSFDKFADKPALHVLNVFASERCIVIAQLPVESDKTNEIPVAQKIVRELDLPAKIYTLDALHCQYKTLKAVKKSKSNCIVQVKNNQRKLEKLCQSISNSWNPVSTNIQNTDLRNKKELRVAKVYKNINYLEQRMSKEWEDLIKCIIKVERTRQEFDTATHKWITSREDAYFVSTKILSAEQANSLIRNHWGIENSLHYVKDVTMGEDNSRIRKSPENMSILRSMALNILRINGEGTIKQKMFRLCCNTNILLKPDYLL